MPMAVSLGRAGNKYRHPLIGTCYLHTVIDDHSRVAYVEARDDETKETAAEVRNAVAWFVERGVTVQRVLSDNGSCYRSHLGRDTCTDLRITPRGPLIRTAGSDATADAMQQRWLVKKP